MASTTQTRHQQDEQLASACEEIVHLGTQIEYLKDQRAQLRAR